MTVKEIAAFLMSWGRERAIGAASAFWEILFSRAGADAGFAALSAAIGGKALFVERSAEAQLVKITPPNNALINKADVRGNLVEVYIIYPQMDEVNPSITEVKLEACIVAIYVTDLVICHWSFVICPLISLISPIP
ncbi:MAG: hypothetical protein V7K66_11200 [Nostoc sp.]